MSAFFASYALQPSYFFWTFLFQDKSCSIHLYSTFLEIRGMDASTNPLHLYVLSNIWHRGIKSLKAQYPKWTHLLYSQEFYVYQEINRFTTIFLHLKCYYNNDAEKKYIIQIFSMFIQYPIYELMNYHIVWIWNHLDIHTFLEIHQRSNH